jgi:hypothetical protein
MGEHMREDLKDAFIALEQDFRRGKEIDKPLDEGFIFDVANKLGLEQYIPADAQVIMALGLGPISFLLSTGLLVLKTDTAVRSIEIISFRDIRGSSMVQASRDPASWRVKIDRNDPAASTLGYKQSSFLEADTASNEYGRLFMARLSEMLNGTGGNTAAPLAADGPLEKISKLKALLDADAITQEEFDIQKAKLLEQM